MCVCVGVVLGGGINGILPKTVLSACRHISGGLQVGPASQRQERRITDVISLQEVRPKTQCIKHTRNAPLEMLLVFNQFTYMVLIHPTMLCTPLLLLLLSLKTKLY